MTVRSGVGCTAACGTGVAAPGRLITPVKISPATTTVISVSAPMPPQIIQVRSGGGGAMGRDERRGLLTGGRRPGAGAGGRAAGRGSGAAGGGGGAVRTGGRGVA